MTATTNVKPEMSQLTTTGLSTGSGSDGGEGTFIQATYKVDFHTRLIDLKVVHIVLTMCL